MVSTGVSYGLPHGDETGLLSGRKSSVNAGKIDTMTETSIISGNNEFYIQRNGKLQRMLLKRLDIQHI